MSNLIFIGGLGSTGSSALVDFLKDTSGFNTVDQEFRLLTDPGGLLTIHTTYCELWSHYQCNSAILNYMQMVYSLSKRFSLKYANLRHHRDYNINFRQAAFSQLDKLIEHRYRGLWYGNDDNLRRYLNKFLGDLSSDLVKKSMIVPKLTSSHQLDEFVRNTTFSILEPQANRSQFFGLNENLCCMYPQKILKIFPQSKMITVIRDPRDVLYDSRRVSWPSIPATFHGYLQWQKTVYDGFLKVVESLDDELRSRFLIIRFEDLVLDFDTTSKNILSFLQDGLPDGDVQLTTTENNLHKCFDPAVSSKNIGQWRGKLSKSNASEIDKNLDRFLQYFKYTDFN
jgi:hypothetical protein